MGSFKSPSLTLRHRIAPDEPTKLSRVSLRDFFRHLRRSYVAVLVLSISSVAVAAIILATQEPSYRASSLLSVDVGLPQEATPEALQAAITYANSRTATLKALVTSDPILDPVIDRLDLDITARGLAEHVIALSAVDTNLIQIRVTWPNAEDSAAIANAIAAESSAFMSSKNEVVSVTVVQVVKAEPASAPVVPNPPMTFGLAVFAALIASTTWIVVRHSRHVSPDDAEV